MSILNLPLQDAYKTASRACPDILRTWERRGQPKIVTKVETEDDLLTIYATALSLGVVASIIQDAGHTQVAPGSRTVVSYCTTKHLVYLRFEQAKCIMAAEGNFY